MIYRMMENWILTAAIFIPVLGAVLIGFVPGQRAKTIKTLALVASLISLALTAVILAFFFNAGPTDRYLLEQNVLWLGPPTFPTLEIHYHLGVDGLSVFLMALTSLLLVLSVFYSFQPVTDRIKEYYILLLILAASCMGVFCAVDLLLFYIFFEFTLVPLFLIIGIWGGPERRIAANKFFIYTLAGSLLTFAGVLVLALQARSFGGMVSFEIPKLLQLSQAGVLNPNVQAWIFLALFAGFAVKVPLFPFHTWLPLAHTEAPTTGSVFLAGILLKLGTYGFLRFCLPILPAAAIHFAPLLAALAVIAILYGALAAWAQKDFKRLVAYSSVSHMGFCILGLFTLKSVGVAGALLYMINHGLSTGALFFVVGMIYDRYHTHRFDDIAGLAGKMPRLTFFAVLFGLSSMALPGLNGFVSEFMVLVGVFISATDRGGTPPGPLHFTYGFFAAGGIVLSAVYILYFIRRVFFGPEHLPPADPKFSADLNKREIAVLTPLAILVVLIGLWPGPILRAIDPACAAVVNAIYKQPTKPSEHPLLVKNNNPGGMASSSRPCLHPEQPRHGLEDDAMPPETLIGKATNPWR